ncbi:MAG TPA: sigma factor [Polyangiaceae bacterium]|nr:sigma factor [Polyangiaceae bacterium]
MPTPVPVDTTTRLADPKLRQELRAAVARRVRSEEVDDILHATFADVLASRRAPEDAEQFRRFVFVVARNRVMDYFRRRGRELPDESVSDFPAGPFSGEATSHHELLSAQDMLRWVEGNLPDEEAKHTLEWMLREQDGERLEQIAKDEQMPAPRLRQRVSRLRRFLRERWAAEWALGGLVAVLGLGALWYWQRRTSAEVVQPERVSEQVEYARRLRHGVMRDCHSGEARRCLEELNRAKRLDPAGDTRPEIVEARRIAGERLAPVPDNTAPDPIAPAPSSLNPKVSPSFKQTAPRATAPNGSAPAPKAPTLPNWGSDSIERKPERK